MLKELDGKIGHLVIELQKKKRALEHEHTETEMVQVRETDGLRELTTASNSNTHSHTDDIRCDIVIVLASAKENSH